MGRPKKQFSKADCEKIKALVLEYKSFDEIGAEFGVSGSHMQKTIMKKFGGAKLIRRQAGIPEQCQKWREGLGLGVGFAIKKYDDDYIARIEELARQGKSMREIAQAMGNTTVSIAGLVARKTIGLRMLAAGY